MLQKPSVRFLESFLHERNIKWMLLTGVLVLLGSSMMLVTSHWTEITPAWKSLVLLAYTAAACGGGWAAFSRCGLRRTGNCLLALTVLLIPINFLCLHLFHADAGAGRVIVQTALLLLESTFAFAASRRVFRHFLRSDQPTFVVSYFLLCAAGTVAPILPASLAPWAAIFLWAVFTAGVVKVNRHVFWLAEEHGFPRIFGFFPVALLGGQFLAVFFLHFARAVPIEWIGFGCALVAAPVLLTSDAVLRVFEQRTGGLVRPLPPAVAAPLCAGLVLCAVSLGLSSIYLFAPGGSPLAFVPSAAVAALCFGVVARRTRKSAFVWVMLAALTLAYNFSPLFFREMVRQLLESGARLVREARLPYAFYGLTYLPLLVALTSAGAWMKKRGEQLFAKPLALFSSGLAAMLLFAGFSHAKAIFPVEAALCGFFLLSAFLHRDRRLILLAALSWVAMFVGLVPFAGGVLGWTLAPGSTQLCAVIAAAALLAPGSALDKLTSRWPPGTSWPSSRAHSSAPCQAASLGLSLLLAAASLASLVFGPAGAVGLAADAGLTVLLAAHAVRRLQQGIAGAAIVFPMLSIAGSLVDSGFNLSDLLGPFTAVWIAIWTAGRALESRRPCSRAARAFAAPALRVGGALLTAALLFIYIPRFIFEMANVDTLITGRPITALAGIAAAFWAFGAARRTQKPILTVLGAAGILCGCGAISRAWLGHSVTEWVPFTWTCICAAAMPIVVRLKRRLLECGDESAGLDKSESLRVVAVPLEWILIGMLALVAAGSMLGFSPPIRLAGMLAAACLIAMAAADKRYALRTLAWIPANWHLLWILVRVCAPQVDTILDLFGGSFRPAALPVAFAAGASAVLFQSAFVQRRTSPGRAGVLHGTALFHRGALYTLSAFALFMSLFQSTLSTLGALLAAASFVLLAAIELSSACERSSAARVWAGEAILAAGVIYFVKFGIITFGRGLSMYVLLGGALLALLASRLAARRPATSILAQPFRATAMILPIGAVALGLWHEFFGSRVSWLGSNSLALLGAAGFYFWQGLEQRRKSLLVLAGGIVNAALLFLWRDLRWTDPQLYLIPVGASVLAFVEILKKEIPGKWHDPLRYAGALVILVSPVFHIVGGSWVHHLTLMVLSACVVLAAIGLRVRVLLYTGLAFLAADLAAMVVRGGIENPNVLWIAGLALGGMIIALAAACENRRETALGKLRTLSAALENWN